MNFHFLYSKVEFIEIEFKFSFELHLEYDYKPNIIISLTFNKCENKLEMYFLVLKISRLTLFMMINIEGEEFVV